MRLRSLLAAATVAVMFVPLAAHADPVCTTAGGSPDNPQITDPSGDWQGAVTGTGAGVAGDINRASGDILGAWITKDSKGVYHADVQLASLGDPTQGSDLNEIVDVYFHNPKGVTTLQNLDNTPSTQDQFVEADFNGRQGAAYEWGDVESGAQSSTNGLGTTSGSVTPAKGIVDIVIPFKAMGLPTAGQDTLTEFHVETRVLIGAIVAGVGGGETVPDDDTTNADDSSCTALDFV